MHASRIADDLHSASASASMQSASNGAHTALGGGRVTFDSGESRSRHSGALDDRPVNALRTSHIEQVSVESPSMPQPALNRRQRDRRRPFWYTASASYRARLTAGDTAGGSAGFLRRCAAIF